ncbi:MAG TPA: hypothetical protein VLM78_05075 [Anaerolineales bacterium]|nr:hypothetical protein [Anaerolineales bacterium]
MSRPRAKRILGMTVPQWTVLGVLVLFICCVVVGGFWWLNSMVAAAYAVPDSPALDVTPLPTFTPLPTATLSPVPSPTPILYESLIPAGWNLFKPATAPGMEIWLPPSYISQTEKEKETSSPVYDVEAARSIMALKDTTPSPYLIFTTLDVSVRPTFANSLDEMIDSDFGALMRTGRLLERDSFVFETESYPARRLIFDINVNGTNAGVAVYVLQVGKNLYYLGFVTAFNELYTRLPAFDQAIQTFRIVPIIPTPVPSPTVSPPTKTPLPQ